MQWDKANNRERLPEAAEANVVVPPPGLQWDKATHQCFIKQAHPVEPHDVGEEGFAHALFEVERRVGCVVGVAQQQLR